MTKNVNYPMGVRQSAPIIFPEIEFWQTVVRPWDSPQFCHKRWIENMLKANLKESKSVKWGFLIK